MARYEYRVTWAYGGQPLWHSSPTQDEEHARSLYREMQGRGFRVTTLRLERRRLVEWEVM